MSAIALLDGDCDLSLLDCVDLFYDDELDSLVCVEYQLE